MAFPVLSSAITDLLTAPTMALFAIPALILAVFWLWNGNRISGLGLICSFLLGSAVVYPVGILEIYTTPLLPQFSGDVSTAAVRAFIHTAFSEEGVKLLVLVGICLLTAGRPAAAVGNGLAVGLGFAAAENLIYAFASPDWQSIGLTRMVTAVPAHAVFGLIMGSLIAHALFRPGRRVALAAAAFLLPALLHGMYNFPLYVLTTRPAAGGADVLGYGSLFAGTVFVGVVIALTSADRAMRPVPVGAGAAPRRGRT